MKGRLKKILSLLLCVSIILCLGACGNDSGTKKKKKVIVKKIIKKEPSSQGDTSSGTNGDTDAPTTDDILPGFTFDDSELENGEDYEEETSPYEVDLNPVTPSETNQKIGMSIYHYAVGEWTESLGDIYGKEETFLNYFRVSSINDLLKVKEMGGMGWALIGNPFPNRTTNTFKEGWAESLDIRMNAYKAAGVWDAFAGFETEEICMGVTAEQFRILTKYLRDTYPDKRVFAVLSMYEVRGSAPAGFTIAPMSYESYGYVTDIGYDWYSHTDYNQFKEAVELMLTNMGRRNNVRVWFLPSTHVYQAGNETGTQQFMIDSLNVLYKLLMELENPGGLYLYTWDTFGNDGLGRLIDPSVYGDEFRPLAERIVEIGQEILNNPYRYTRPYN